MRPLTQSQTQPRTRLPALALALLLAFLLGSCGGEDRSKAQLRLVNASSGYAALDLHVDEERLQSAVAYGATDRYVEVDPRHTLTEITRAGSTTPLVSTTPVLAKGDHYTLVAYGAEGALKAALLDDNASAPASGKARLRVLNAAPEAGNVDVFLTAEDAPLADAEALHPGAVAGTVSAYSEVDAATWRLRVTAAGDRDDLRLDLSGIALASRQIVTVVVTPGGGGVLVNVLVVTQRGVISALAGVQARVRVVAAVTDSGAVAAAVGGVPLMNGIGAPAAGSYRLVPAGTAAASVTVDGQPVSVPAATLPAGNDLTLMVWGPASAPVAAWIADDNRPPTVAGRAKLRLVHGVATLDAAIALTLDFSPVADGVTGGTASGPAQVEANAAAALTVTAAGRGSPLWSAVDQSLAAGSVYTLFVVGSVGSPTGILRKDR